MAEPSYAARRMAPLDGAVAVGEIDGVTLTAAEPAARFVLRGAADAASAAGAAFGAPLPQAINRAAEGTNGRGALKIGPDEWLLIAPGAEPAEIFAALRAGIG